MSVSDLTNTLAVVTEERDLSRGKEEEYFLALEETQGELDRIQQGYVELSDRLNDKLDEVFDLQSDLESAKAATLHWQQLALTGGGAETAAAAAGSGVDAIQKRRKENLLRATIIRIYEQVVSRFNTPIVASNGTDASGSGATTSAPAPDPSAAAASTPPKDSGGVNGVAGGDGDDGGAGGNDGDDSDDDYSDDYEDDEFEAPATPLASSSAPQRHDSAKVLPLKMSQSTGGAPAPAVPTFSFDDPALTTPRAPLTADEVADLPLEELCGRLEACIGEVDQRRVALVTKLYKEVLKLATRVQELEAR